MKNCLKILLIIFLISAAGCEVEEIIKPEDVYTEYTVVHAEIQPNIYFPAVRFTKTLPLGVPYRIEDAELKNVTAYIKKNGVQVIPLIYTSEGLYKPLNSFVVSEGETYELFAETDDKFIYAKTSIPHKPNVTSVSFNTSEYFMNARITTKADEVYGAVWIISQVPPEVAGDFYSVTKASYKPGTEIIIRTQTISENFRSSNYSGKRYLQAVSFDKSFREYFYSRTSGQEINDPFIQGGGEVEWNVQGDKVIGMFIGVAPGEIIYIN